MKNRKYVFVSRSVSCCIFYFGFRFLEDFSLTFSSFQGLLTNETFPDSLKKQKPCRTFFIVLYPIIIRVVHRVYNFSFASPRNWKLQNIFRYILWGGINNFRKAVFEISMNISWTFNYTFLNLTDVCKLT